MIPLRLVMENFAAHQRSVLDFTKFDSALLMGAKNGNPDVSNATGKTTVFRAIFWVLFGKSDFSIKEKVVRRGKSACSVEFTFEVGGTVYKIVRKLNKKSNTIDVTFARKEGREWVMEGLTCNTPTATNRKIEEVIGMNYDTGVSSIYFRQNDTFGFAGSRASNRKDILREILALGMWDLLQQDAKDCEKKLEDQREALHERLVQLGNVENEKETAQKRLASAETEITRVRDEVLLLEEDLAEINDALLEAKLAILGSKTAGAAESQTRLTEIDAETQLIEAQKTICRDQVKLNNRHLQDADENIGLLEKRLFNYSRWMLAVAERASDKAKATYSKLVICTPHPEEPQIPKYSRSSLAKKMLEQGEARREADSLGLQLKQLMSLEPGKECPTCLVEIENPAEVLARREARKIELMKAIDDIRLRLEGLDVAIAEESEAVRKADEAYVEMERAELMIAKFMANISEYHKSNEESQKKLNDLAQREYDLEKERLDISAAMESPTEPQQKADGLERLAEQARRQIREKQDILMECGVAQGNARGYLDELERRESECAALTEEGQKLARLSETYRKLAKAFGKDGIQAIIMENVTQDLQDYANSILKQVCDEQMSVSFVTQRQTGAGGWKEDFDIQIATRNSTEDFDDLSGGEQVRVAISLRLALSQLLMNRIGRNIQFLLLDEVDRDLDRQGIEALADVIRRLSKRFKILVITHNELMKEKFEHILVVQKGPDGSVLKQ